MNVFEGDELDLNCFSGPFREIPRILSKIFNHRNVNPLNVDGPFFAGTSTPEMTLKFTPNVTALK